jgi:threonine dehydratase
LTPGALDAVLASVGGGGLIGGIAAWFTDRISVVGVEPELAQRRFEVRAGSRIAVVVSGGNISAVNFK